MEYGKVITRDCGDGWFEAEFQLDQWHPRLFATAKSLARARRKLRAFLKSWDAR